MHWSQKKSLRSQYEKENAYFGCSQDTFYQFVNFGRQIRKRNVSICTTKYVEIYLEHFYTQKETASKMVFFCILYWIVMHVRKL